MESSIYLHGILEFGSFGRNSVSFRLIFKIFNKIWKNKCLKCNAEQRKFALMRFTKLSALVALCASFFLATAPKGLHAEEPIMGINVVNPLWLPVSEQDKILEDVHAAGIKVIRMPVSNAPQAAVLRFLEYASTLGIQTDLIVGPEFPANARKRPKIPGLPWVYAGPFLSDADTDLSRSAFMSLLTELDKRKIKLTALELGNEINWAPFNRNFPVPGQGRILNANDLEHDPEGRAVAKSYLKYLQILSVLKQARDQSLLNSSTPILLAGLAGMSLGKLQTQDLVDGVSVQATLDYLRQHGLDTYVDGYGVHIYIQNAQLMSPAQIAEIFKAKISLSPSEKFTKPLWITEWGSRNFSTSCPLNDTTRAQDIRAQIRAFEPFLKTGQVKSLIYFAWNTQPGQKTTDTLSVFRCGTLTEAGRMAVQPPN